MNARKNTGHSFEAYFKRATSSLVVLRLLLEKPMYGYELTQEMEKRSNGRFTVSLLYPVIYRLEKLGYVEVVQSEVVDGRARNYYGITESGRSHLKKTLVEYQQISDVFAAIIAGCEAYDL